MMEINRMFVGYAEEDRISNLPEHLIDSILERVPFEDAVRTSIISKRWRYRWTTMRALVFDEHFSKKFAKNGAFGRNGFIRIINKALIFHKGPILKFHLHIPKMLLDSFEEVDQWILLLSRNGVRELILTNRNQRYQLPPYMFSCLELTKLKLDNCFFKPPLGFEGFPILEELSHNNIDFGATLCGIQMTLPQLKHLYLHSCTHVHNFNIKATNLLTLVLSSCPDAMLLRLLDSPCLLGAGIYCNKLIEDSVQVEKMSLATLLSKLPRVSHFCIDSHFLKFLIAEKIPKLLPCALNSLVSLRLLHYDLGDLDQLHVALCLLRNSPNLESLRMYLNVEPRVDAGPASNRLESPNCWDCTLNRLQTVEITCLKGSRPELLFIKLLLAHSPSLTKFTIRPNKTFDAQKRLEIAEDVMRFPRASPKAELIYLNPKP